MEHEHYLHPVNPLGKRLFDIIAGSLLLVIALPIMLIVGLLIVCESGWPPFYMQKRVGLGGKPFTIVKFRTLSPNAGKTVVFTAIRPTPNKLTRFSRFLRNSSLDELPQLFNVIKGDMSLVGPRAHAIEFAKHYISVNRRYMRRHAVKPGMTGLVQLTDLRHATESDRVINRRVRYDLYYVRNFSLIMDMWVLWRTLLMVVRPIKNRIIRLFQVEKQPELLNKSIRKIIATGS